MDNLAEIEARHRRGEYASWHGDGVTIDTFICEYDRKSWPCDAHLLLAEVKRLLSVPEGKVVD